MTRSFRQLRLWRSPAREGGADIQEEALNLALEVDVAQAMSSRGEDGVDGTVQDLTSGDTHVSLDALESSATCFDSVAGLRKHGNTCRSGR